LIGTPSRFDNLYGELADKWKLLFIKASLSIHFSLFLSNIGERKMEQKELQQYTTAKQSIELLYHRVNQCVTLDELNQVITHFNSYILKYAPHKNNRTNKNISAVNQYYKEQKKFAQRNRQAIIENDVLSNVRYRVSYKDYRSEMLRLRERGLSYQKISNYAKNYWDIKVSKDTIRNFLNNS
jgi:hypothetical protein